jgi:hypothetical protein
MYDARSSGRRSHRFFAPEMGARMRARHALELDLRQSYKRRRLRNSLPTARRPRQHAVTGCEALLRWNHRERGMVSPAEFIPLAEETGLITELGDWVLGQACLDAVSWPDHIMLAVNVSPVQFKSKTLALRVARRLLGRDFPRTGWSSRSRKIYFKEGWTPDNGWVWRDAIRTILVTISALRSRSRVNFLNVFYIRLNVFYIQMNRKSEPWFLVAR